MGALQAAPHRLFAGNRGLIGVLVGSLLAGCSINPPLDLAALAGDQPPLQLSTVPFFPQADFECGPAALAGMLGAAGLEITPDALSPQVYLPGRQGSLQLELLAATRRAGRIPYLVEPNPGALLAELEAGRPVLVFQNLRTPHFPIWHYAVLVGFDTAANLVYLNSGAERALPMAAPTFLRTWDWAGHWALVTLRPGELPARVDITRYAEAVAGFEAIAGAAAAEPAWRAAMLQWPEDPRPLLALGNQAYGEGDLLGAASYYRQGLLVHRGAPALTNNLASVLGELGCPHSGIELLRPVEQALAVDSGWRDAIAATLAELTAGDGSDGGHCAEYN